MNFINREPVFMYAYCVYLSLSARTDKECALFALRDGSCAINIFCKNGN